MARPTRLNADYFYHPADLRNDRRVVAIRARLGLAGYGLLLMLLEVLTDAAHNRLDTDEVELELLAGDLRVEAGELTDLVQQAERVRFFARTEDGLLHCPALDEWLAVVYEKRSKVKAAQQERRGVSAETTRNNAAAASTSLIVSETTPIVSETMGVVSETTPPVEKSRVEYSREDSIESSSVEPTHFAGEGAGGFEKKSGAVACHATPLPAQAMAAHTEGGAARVATPIPAAPPPGLPEWKRQGYYRDFEAAWPVQLKPYFGTPAFHAAWRKYAGYRIEIGKAFGGEIGEQQALDTLHTYAGGDPARALRILSHNITQQYRTLVNDDGSSIPKPSATGQRGSSAQQRREVAPAGSQRSAA